jgi:hypothetical protein
MAMLAGFRWLCTTGGDVESLLLNGRSSCVAVNSWHRRPFRTAQLTAIRMIGFRGIGPLAQFVGAVIGNGWANLPRFRSAYE